MPLELALSRILAEFPGVLPSQLEGEPILPLLKIVEARRYEQAVRADEDHARRVRAGQAESDDAPTGPVIDLMYEVQGWKIEASEEQ